MRGEYRCKPCFEKEGNITNNAIDISASIYVDFEHDCNDNCFELSDFKALIFETSLVFHISPLHRENMMPLKLGELGQILLYLHLIIVTVYTVETNSLLANITLYGEVGLY
jgi:hypothetical protein